MPLLTSLLHPEGYHGHRRTRRFFEGWYVKLVSADRAQRWAVIPGVFLGPSGGGEAFVQVLDGTSRRSWYHRYPLDAFTARADDFEVSVGDNHFSRRGIRLALPSGPLAGELTFTSAFTPWPVSLTSPGVMGPFAFVPFMECYHGVVSFLHGLAGALTIDGVPTAFDGGTGYLEKDWGQAFPSGYIWTQCNHFEGGGTSLMASAAIIPWLGGSFPGFIAGLWREGTLYRFATYTGARLERLQLDDTRVHLTLADRRHRLALTIRRSRGGVLHAPVRTEMHRRVEESLDAELDVRLGRVDGDALFEGRGAAGGLEVHGDVARLTAMAGSASPSPAGPARR